MNRMKLSLAVILTAVLLATGLAWAQTLPRLRLAAGPQGGTYYDLANNMAQYCGQGLRLDVQQTGGSDENIAALLGNKADNAIVQLDILYKRSKYGDDQSVKNFLAVMPLHLEAMHLVALERSGLTKFSELGATKAGWMPGSGRAAKKVAAYGGSIESAEIIKAVTGVNYEIVVVPDRGTALNALVAGQVDALLAMGGTPMGWVEKELKRGQHRLLEFDVNIDERVGYKKSNLTYAKLGVNGLKTVATPAVLITRNFTTQEKIRTVSLLRECVWSQLSTLQEADDTHGQWQNIKKDEQVQGWSWFAGMKVQWPPVGAQQSPRR